jgi:Tfp pilus assembly protein PilF
MMKDDRLREQVYYGARKATPEMQRLDSLQFRAMMLNPFLFRRFDRDMFIAVIRENYIRRVRQTNGAREPNPWEINQLIEDYLRKGTYEMRGWMAYGASDFQTALDNYASGLGSARNKSFVRMERARIFGMRGQADSAIAEFTQAVEEQQKKDEKQLVVLYDSKAMAEYSIGVLLEGAGNASAAREAFGRALQEDLAYYPAHMHLGLVALGQGDSTTAMSELALAAQIAPDEPYVQYVNGYVLASMKHYAEAEKSLRKTVELEPYYALPYLRLGQVYEQLVKAKEAHDAYKAFLDHAAKSDVQRDLATARLAEVDSYLQAPGVAP